MSLHNEEGLSGMKVLLHRDITVANGPVSHGIDMIPIGIAVMAQVMADPCQQEREDIHLIKLQELGHIPLGQEEVAHVSHINTMEVIMILDILFVGEEDLIHKVSEFRFVYQTYYFVRKEHI
jgi:hypothetical protein